MSTPIYGAAAREKQKPNGLTQLILDELRQAEPATSSDIAAAIGRPPHNVSAILAQLQLKGKLERSRDGAGSYLYQFPQGDKP